MILLKQNIRYFLRGKNHQYHQLKARGRGKKVTFDCIPHGSCPPAKFKPELDLELHTDGPFSILLVGPSAGFSRQTHGGQ